MKLLYATLLSAIIFTSCQSSDKEIKSIVTELDCKRILIPEQLSFQVLDAFVDIKSQTYDYTIINYIDSSGCTPCRMKQPLWNETINEFKSLPDIDIECVTIINSDDEKAISHLIKQNEYKHPVTIDNHNIFYQTNNLPAAEKYHTFLLDANHKILAIGNPAINPKIKNLYKKIILNSFNEDPLTDFAHTLSQSLGAIH